MPLMCEIFTLLVVCENKNDDGDDDDDEPSWS